MPIHKKDLDRIKALIQKYPEEVVDCLLSLEVWPSEILTDTAYERRSDDTDGANDVLGITFSGAGLAAGDAFISIFSRSDPDPNSYSHFYGTHRFRTSLGGGASSRVHKALLMLALAIKRDNEKMPFHP